MIGDSCRIICNGELPEKALLLPKVGYDSTAQRSRITKSEVRKFCVWACFLGVCSPQRRGWSGLRIGRFLPVRRGWSIICPLPKRWWAAAFGQRTVYRTVCSTATRWHRSWKIETAASVSTSAIGVRRLLWVNNWSSFYHLSRFPLNAAAVFFLFVLISRIPTINKIMLPTTTLASVRMISGVFDICKSPIPSQQ